MKIDAMRFSGFDSAAFLRETWQQRPLLIRNPWNEWRNPIEPDELAGLACEEYVESRLITRTREAWTLEHGPLPESRFGRLGRLPWTLLVQAVDHHVPDVAVLLEAFRFMPNWRLDDVMVSYAVDGGGVGPHFDNYDVFLVQGLGRRRWRVGEVCDRDTPLLPHDDLRLLARFEPAGEWILEPGDILYVPPRLAHDGVALGDGCMTYSIGFRAPARAELIAGWCESLVAGLDDDDRYADPNPPAQGNPGEILPRALADLHALVTEKLLDREAFADWFGRYCTAPKDSEVDWRPDEPVGIAELRLLLAADVPLRRNPACRFSFIRKAPDRLSLFVNGDCFDAGGEAARFAERLCARAVVSVGVEAAGSPAALELIARLLNQGAVAFDTAR